MTSASRTPTLPQIPGTREPTLADVFRLVWWSEKGFWHRVAKSGKGRPTALLLALLWWPTWPFHIAGRAVLMSDKATRYYYAEEGDAVLAVRICPDYWLVTEHVSRRPGHGLGARLRAKVAPALVDAARASHISIRAVTTSSRLAGYYARELAAGGAIVTPGPRRFTLELSPDGERPATR